MHLPLINLIDDAYACALHTLTPACAPSTLTLHASYVAPPARPTQVAAAVIHKLGMRATLLTCCAAAALRFGGYVSITSPWWVLPFEAFHGYIFALSFTSMAVLAEDFSAKGMQVHMHASRVACIAYLARDPATPAMCTRSPHTGLSRPGCRRRSSVSPTPRRTSALSRRRSSGRASATPWGCVLLLSWLHCSFASSRCHCCWSCVSCPRCSQPSRRCSCAGARQCAGRIDS